MHQAHKISKTFLFQIQNLLFSDKNLTDLVNISQQVSVLNMIKRCPAEYLGSVFFAVFRWSKFDDELAACSAATSLGSVTIQVHSHESNRQSQAILMPDA
jgi:hypothetical protein